MESWNPETSPMPKLPDMSPAAVKKRQQLTEAAQAQRAKEPPPPPVVKVRIAKPR
jgi:hypothetical protein